MIYYSKASRDSIALKNVAFFNFEATVIALKIFVQDLQKEINNERNMFQPSEPSTEGIKDFYKHDKPTLF